MEMSCTKPGFSVDPEQAIVLFRSMPLLHNVPEATLMKLLEAVQPVRFGPGESIVQVGGDGAGLYIIWKGEAKVTTPPSDYPRTHKESFLTSGDYFGTATTGPRKKKYEADVVAITEVFGLLLAHENADLLSECSAWDWGSLKVPPKALDCLFQFETLKPDLFQTSGPVPFKSDTGRTFGGQLIGQALYAATKTVLPALVVHSLHCYFLRPGDQDVPITYEVERTFEGQSSATRHVAAMQKGKTIFVLYASFKVEVGGLQRSEPMPRVPRPEEAISREERLDSYLADPRVPLTVKKKFTRARLPPVPVESHYVDPGYRFQPVHINPNVVMEPSQRIWFRSREKLPEEQTFHRCFAAFASDFDLLETALRPYPKLVKLQALSLDHTIWFHGPFKADEWLLFVIKCSTAASGRALCVAQIYTQEGKLVMSVGQEGVVRKTPETAKL